jgi:hypothetical protein
MPEITTITSESLQAEVRRLLPSQRGFGGDLEAQNVIVPIVDLTPTAEGSSLREDLQTASSHGAITATSARDGSSTTVVNTPGFFKYNATLTVLSDGTTNSNQATINLSDGLSVKPIHDLRNSSDSNPEEPVVVSVTGTCFLNTGDSLTLVTAGSDAQVRISVWPVANVNGDYINPSGFTFE